MPDAVGFADSLDAVLQSAREAAAFRIEAEGQDNADKYQVTRTAVAYVNVDGVWYAAFDDVADPEKNIILARSKEGCKSHEQQGKWLLPKRDRHVRSLLDRAEKDERIVEVPENRKLVRLLTGQYQGKSEFGQYDTNKAIFGPDISEAYAAMRNQSGCEYGYDWLLTAKDLKDLDVGKKVEVRGVGIGNVHNYVVAAGYLFSYDGFARGMRSARDFHRTEKI